MKKSNKMKEKKQIEYREIEIWDGNEKWKKRNEMWKYGAGQSRNGGCRMDSSFSWRRSV